MLVFVILDIACILALGIFGASPKRCSESNGEKNCVPLPAFSQPFQYCTFIYAVLKGIFVCVLMKYMFRKRRHLKFEEDRVYFLRLAPAAIGLPANGFALVHYITCTYPEAIKESRVMGTALPVTCLVLSGLYAFASITFLLETSMFVFWPRRYLPRIRSKSDKHRPYSKMAIRHLNASLRNAAAVDASSKAHKSKSKK